MIVGLIVFFSFLRVEDKQKVASLTIIPRYLPEVTIGAHEFDKGYYSFKSVRTLQRLDYERLYGGGGGVGSGGWVLGFWVGV